MFRSIDFRQAAILTRYALVSEWRLSSLRARAHSGRRKFSRGWAYWTVILYLFIGSFSVRLFIENRTGEPYVTAVAILFLYAAFIIASNIFMSFGTGFLSPEETAVVAPLPVSSETFFFSRLAVLICYTTVISILLGIGPFVGLQFFLHTGLLQNLAFLAALLLSGFAAALSVIVLYGVLMRIVGRSRVSQAFGYIQFLGSFVTALGFIAISQVERHIDLQSLTVSTTHWLAYIPAVWFASLAALPTGLAGTYSLLAIGGVIFLSAVATGAHLLLARHYQDEVAELSISAASVQKRKHGRESFIARVYSRFARSDEARAVLTVLRAQFRYDAKFRMQLMSTLPLTFLYLLIAILQGGITDPFGGNLKAIIRMNTFYLVAMLMPLITMQSVAYSENFRSSWIFFAAPLDRAKLLLAVRYMLLVSIVLPYMVILTVIFLQYMPAYHAIPHTLVLAAIAGINFQLYLMVSPKMPFAQPRRPNRNGFAMMFGVFSFVIFSMLLFLVVIYFGYHSFARFWPIFLLLVTVSAALERGVHARIHAKLEREEFEG